MKYGMGWAGVVREAFSKIEGEGRGGVIKVALVEEIFVGREGW